MNARSGRFALAVFASLLSVLLTWTWATPLFASPDEPAHLYKAYGVAHGQLVGSSIPDQPSNIRLFDVPDTLGQPNVMCYFFQPDVPAGCASGSSSAGVSAAAVYPPFWYGLVGGGARLVGGDESQRAHRTIAAILVAALVATAFAVAERSSRRALAPLMLIGLTPMTLFLAGSVNPNGFEIAGFLLLWSMCLHLDAGHAASRRSGVMVGSVAATLVLCRFASAMWLAGGAVVLAVALGLGGLRPFLRRSFIVPVAALTAAAAAVVVAWSAAVGITAEDERVALDVGTGEVIRMSWERLPDSLRQMIGVLGWLDTEIPWFAHLAFALMTIVALVGVVASRDRRAILAAAVILVGLLAAPIAVNVASASSAGLIWQGRYAIPLLSMLGLLGMLGWGRVLAPEDGPSVREPGGARPPQTWRRSSALVPTLRIGVATCFVVAEVAAFWQALRRFTVGADGKVWLDRPLGWEPPFAPMLLVAANASFVLVFAAIIVRGCRANRLPAPEVASPGVAEGHAE